MDADRIALNAVLDHSRRLEMALKRTDEEARHMADEIHDLRRQLDKVRMAANANTAPVRPENTHGMSPNSPGPDRRNYSGGKDGSPASFFVSSEGEREGGFSQSAATQSPFKDQNERSDD